MTILVMYTKACIRTGVKRRRRAPETARSPCEEGEGSVAETNVSDQQSTAEELAVVSAGFESAPASAVIRWAIETFGDSLVLAASFEDIVLIDLVTKVAPDVEVVFLDTEAHFPETLAFVDDMRERYGLNLTVTKPGPEAAAYPCGSDQCCQFRKVEPLRRALAGKRAWLTSLKRSDGPTRADAPIVGWDAGFGSGEGQSTGHVDRGGHLLLPLRPRPPGPPAHPAGLPLHRMRTDDAPGGRGRGCPCRSLGGCRQVRVRPARLVPRDLDNPYGMEFRGRRDRGLKFVRPYRNIGELNPTEQLKLSRHPFEVAQAIIDTYSKQGVDSINKVPGELERFKWVGMYPQRQGGDAFMMRIKVPGGVMTAAQVREIGVAADAFAEGPDESPVFGNRYADLTTRQDIQLHWIRIADVPRIWQRFWDVGLTTVQACGDSARNVCSCPVSGIDQKEVVAALPVAAGHFGFLHRESRVRQPAPQVQDRRHRLHGGLRPGRNQRHRIVAGGAGRRDGRLQRAHRRRPLRRRAHGFRH